MAELNAIIINWIESALRHVGDYGEIHIKIHGGKVTKVYSSPRIEISPEDKDLTEPEEP